MKKFALKLVSVFEIICGLGGIVMVLGGILGIMPYEAVLVLWFGIFPILGLVAGVMLWLGSKYATQLSTLVLLLQIPFVYISGYSLMRFGLAFNLYITAIWNARAGVNATILGINFLALGMLFILLWSKNNAADSDQLNNIV